MNPLPIIINDILNAATELFASKTGMTSSHELLLPAATAVPALFSVDESAQRIQLPFLEGELLVSLPFPSENHIVSGSLLDHTLLFGFVPGSEAFLLEESDSEGAEED